MADLKALSKELDTSVEILQAIRDHQGGDLNADDLREAIENPEDFDALVTRARELAGDASEPLRWQGREVI